MTTSDMSGSTTSTLRPPSPSPQQPPSSDVVSLISKKAYGSVVLTLENVLIPSDKLTPSPSAIDGLDAESEIFLRVGGCELIQTSGILLKLPQVAMATGQVLFQRFYYSKSFVRQPMETTAMACIYLASKIEEASPPRRIRDVINVFHHIRQIRANKVIQPLILDPTYIRLKNDVMLAERRVLKELGFCVHVKHPHKIIVIYLQQLDFANDEEFVQKCWNYMNDALRTNVFVRFTPEAIACACIFLSARNLKIPLPSSPAWYLVFNVSKREVMEISSCILELYERPPINYEELERKVDKLAKAYQELRAQGKPISLAQVDKDGKEKESSDSPIPLSISKNDGDKKDIEKRRESGATTKRHHESNGDKYNHHDSHGHHGRVERRRSPPSPIVYSRNSSTSLSKDPTHVYKDKSKKRKKVSRYSHSRSRSPDRKISSKKSKRDRTSISPSLKKHHKKKSHHRRSSSRSRSRSRDERRTSTKKQMRREREFSPPPPPPQHEAHYKRKPHYI